MTAQQQQQQQQQHVKIIACSEYLQHVAWVDSNFKQINRLL